MCANAQLTDGGPSGSPESPNRLAGPPFGAASGSASSCSPAKPEYSERNNSIPMSTIRLIVATLRTGPPALASRRQQKPISATYSPPGKPATFFSSQSASASTCGQSSHSPSQSQAILSLGLS